MKNENSDIKAVSIGILGFGAFGKLIARHTAAHFDVFAHDIAPDVAGEAGRLGAIPTTFERAASCDIVVIATPVSSFEDVVSSVAGYCRPGALVMDVGSVKVGPAALLRAILPDTVDIVATHPLFGPQSASDGIGGLKIAICPVRGDGYRMLACFLRRRLGLQVIVTTPEEHDREAATVQGLTHLIAKVLTRMGALPSRMTTRSFDMLVEAVSMVQHDAPEVFEAIENSNPYSAEVRRRFFEHAHRLNCELEQHGRRTSSRRPMTDDDALPVSGPLP